jgi:hypothetical protein
LRFSFKCEGGPFRSLLLGPPFPPPPLFLHSYAARFGAVSNNRIAASSAAGLKAAQRTVRCNRLLCVS